MDLEEARAIARDVAGRLERACERVAVAGSVRREAPEAKDVELVYVPRMVEEPVDLFATAPGPMTPRLIADLVRGGYWHPDTQGKRDGLGHERLIHAASGAAVELFRAQPENWGLQLAIQTGPELFNRMLADRMGGAMPMDMKMEDGFLWRRGLRLDTPTEEIFFAELGLPWIAPAERTAGRLWEILRERRASHSVPGHLAGYGSGQPGRPAREAPSHLFSE